MFNNIKPQHYLIIALTAIFLFAAVSPAVAGDDDESLVGMSLEELLGMNFSDEATEGITIYGYMSTNVEKVLNEPSIENGVTVRNAAPHEWSLPHFNLFLRTPLSNNISTFVNIASEDLEVRNMWGNIKFKDEFQIKFGKIYRDFGLFNAKLDEVPTYLGIEPPELFDGDHLILPRLTTFVVHGTTNFNKNSLSWSLCTDNGENGPIEDVLPLGWDIRTNIGGKVVVGASGYFSSITKGTVSSDKAVGEGSPNGGVLPWMASDDYKVYGGFTEFQVNNFLIKGAYWYASHDAVRDPDAVLTLVNEADLTDRQRVRFLGDNAFSTDITAGDVDINGDYNVTTGYVRVGYHIPSKYGSVTPYVFYDWMENKETIAQKTYGGDNEAGISDDGKFYKWTFGATYKPIDKVAVKANTAFHVQEFNGESISYGEVRFDISYLFK